MNHLSVPAAVSVALLVILLGTLRPGLLFARHRIAEPSPDPERRYFGETEFAVSGEFLRFFNIHGGLEVFGYPISAPFNERGVLVQYFQKGRMEWRATGQDSGEVTLGNLGEELGFARPRVAPPPLSIHRVYYEETGHSVAHMFLRYFRDRGGVALFGYPISGMALENQKVVQYFQRAKLIWDPGTAELTVGNLGALYVRAHRSNLPYDAFTPLPYRYGDHIPQELRVLLGASQSIVDAGEDMTVTVVVLDPRANAPLADVTVRFTMDRLDASAALDVAPWTYTVNTDQGGKAVIDVPLDSVEPGTWGVLTVSSSLGPAYSEAKQLFLVW